MLLQIKSLMKLKDNYMTPNEIIQKSILENRLSHLYLITGSKGEYRDQKILEVVQTLSEDTSSDKAGLIEKQKVTWIETETQVIKKQQIQDLFKEFSKTSLQNQRKIYVIEDAEKLNMTLPIETHLLQACVSEPVKPVLDGVVTFGAGHFYISQSDKGEMVMGGDLDGYNSYAQRGNLPTIQHVLTGGLALFPFLSRLKMLRTWGGIMDMSMDGSPIIDKTHIDGLYLNCGWCYGGFKSTPISGWTFAHTIAQDRLHELNADLTLNRFSTGYLLDEKGLGTKTWIS